MAPFAGRQQRAELVSSAAAHRIAGDDVLGDGRVHEALWRIDLDLAGCHVGLADDALDAAEMVGMAVAVDHRDDRLLRPVLVVQLKAGPGGLGIEQRVDDDQAGLALDDGHVCEVDAAQLVHAVGDLEQAGDRIDLRLAPQARVDRGRRVALLEVIGAHVPGRHAVWTRVRAGDQAAGNGRDEAAPRILEGLLVGPGQGGAEIGIGLHGGRLRRLRRDLRMSLAQQEQGSSGDQAQGLFFACHHIISRK